MDPLPLYHFNALTTVGIGTLLYGGRGAIYRKFSVSNFWSEMNRVGATITSTLGSMTYLLANDIDRPEMPLSGQPEANRSLRLIGAVPMPPEVDDVIRNRFGVTTFSGAYGALSESDVVATPWDSNKAVRPGSSTTSTDVRSSMTTTASSGKRRGRDRCAPSGAVMFEGYWGRPDVTVETSRNWWYHTGDIGRIDEDRYLYFVDRKADYLRRRGENISSFEVESVLMSHGGLADVAVHAVPSQLSEDDLKVTAVIKANQVLSAGELFEWCTTQLPYFALPRYIEFRDDLPRSPVGRVLKPAGIEYERR
jgi:crotonobetaine/carnitine-CoA ligase